MVQTARMPQSAHRCVHKAFVGSTYGLDGIIVAVRIGFDGSRSQGGMETGGRVARPVVREVMLKIYLAKIVGPVPSSPANMENNIAEYLGGTLCGERNDAIFQFARSPRSQ
jgi:membrane carboxypeptidase/penicillin-binding protein